MIVTVMLYSYITVTGYLLICLTDVNVRLVGGRSYNEGRVEVNYDGEWGTVCDDGWDDTDAGVVCRQLGFGSYGRTYRSYYFGQGSGPIWLDSVTCTGNESTLASCGHLGVRITRSCNHYEDAGLRCFGEKGLAKYVYFYELYLRMYIYKMFCTKTHSSDSQGQEKQAIRDEQVSYLHVAQLKILQALEISHYKSYCLGFARLVCSYYIESMYQ